MEPELRSLRDLLALFARACREASGYFKSIEVWLMIAMAVSANRPRLLVPGLTAADPFLETYFVRPGGATVLTLRPDDRAHLGRGRRQRLVRGSGAAGKRRDRRERSRGTSPKDAGDLQRA